MEEKKESIRLIRFFHPEKRLDFLPGSENVNALANFFGLSEQEYLDIKGEFRENVENCAKQLIEEPIVSEAISTIKLKTGDSIAVIGDSLTDDYQSWFEILKKTFQILRPELQLQWHNTALSGDTSMQLFSTLSRLESIKPDYLFCLIGTNDGRIHGSLKKHCTSIDEVSNNFDAIESLGKSVATKKFIWMTPVGVDERRIREDWLLTRMGAIWDDRHILKISDLIMSRVESKIDLRKILPDDREEVFIEDGLHWSLSFQKRVARNVIENFSVMVNADGEK
ncbi:SGNH/GDSL hydrolase family protein [Agarilytica rhodophyticola]|uniref:SGNH/GDSL hydrolase family protein n=1 Tax=Agarilytica rhodophyticola TaxID=1737490 RepID=UPI000B3427E6|nr:SGNH/GDSL hydrolase family protein [Agarilytica rhodophyticola]